MKLARVFALLAIAIGSAGVPTACSGGVVGGECRGGFGACHGHCLDLRSDVENCGACDKVCAPDAACVEGVCTVGVVPDGSVGDASGTGGRGAGGSAGSGGSGGNADASIDGGGGSVGALDGGDGSVGGRGGRGGNAGAGTAGNGAVDSGAPDGSTCRPPFDSPEHCGRCDVQCPPDKPVCTYLEGYFCTTLCDPPLVQCGQQCVNTDNDPDNCGKCGNKCVSGICQGGKCVGALAGHEVLMCMDYGSPATAGTPQAKLLENAVFLGTAATVRILGYQQYTTPANINTVKNSLDVAAAAQAPRKYTLTVAKTGADVANNLSIFDYEVLLVYDQPGAPAGKLGEIGATWVGPIDSFVRAGGTVVTLAGTAGSAEMDELLTSAGLLDVSEQTSITNGTVYNRAPFDAIGINVLSQFRAPNESCTFTTPAPGEFTIFVVTDAPGSSGTRGNPSVVHKVLAP